MKNTLFDPQSYLPRGGVFARGHLSFGEIQSWQADSKTDPDLWIWWRIDWYREKYQSACGYLLTLDATFMKGLRCTFWWNKVVFMKFFTGIKTKLSCVSIVISYLMKISKNWSKNVLKIWVYKWYYWTLPLNKMKYNR